MSALRGLRDNFYFLMLFCAVRAQAGEPFPAGIYPFKGTSGSFLLGIFVCVCVLEDKFYWSLFYLVCKCQVKSFILRKEFVNLFLNNSSH